MTKNSLVEASKAYITEKYGEIVANASEYSYSGDDSAVTSRITNNHGKLIGYITTWIDNNNIQHHIH